MTKGRPLYEGVDWNHMFCFKVYTLSGRPLYEGVDWNLSALINRIAEVKSPSLRGRGLKWYLFKIFCKSSLVALFTRAWIEMVAIEYHDVFKRRRPLYEGVDWNGTIIFCMCEVDKSPSLRGRGLKSWYSLHILSVSCVALFTRAWIEISYRTQADAFFRASPSLRGRGLKSRGTFLCKAEQLGRPLYEGVDWNILYLLYCINLITSPSLRGRGLK